MQMPNINTHNSYQQTQTIDHDSMPGLLPNTFSVPTAVHEKQTQISRNKGDSSKNFNPLYNTMATHTFKSMIKFDELRLQQEETL